MSDTKWYKIETNKGKDGPYHYIGASSLSFENLSEKAERGEFVRLDGLLYFERGEYKEWADWDKSLEPSVLIHPARILSIMQFKGDPRKISSK
jgi:hypothetical protein